MYRIKEYGQSELKQHELIKRIIYAENLCLSVGLTGHGLAQEFSQARTPRYLLYNIFFLILFIGFIMRVLSSSSMHQFTQCNSSLKTTLSQTCQNGTLNVLCTLTNWLIFVFVQENMHVYTSKIRKLYTNASALIMQVNLWRILS